MLILIYMNSQSKKMNISDIMTKKVITVEMDDPLSIVKEIFDNAKFHHLIVIDEGKFAGIVAERDLLNAISPNIGTNRYTPRDLETLNKRVHQIMVRNAPSTYPGNNVNEAIEMFNTKQISCLPIVDGDNNVVGIVTWHDIIRNFWPIAKATIKVA